VESLGAHFGTERVGFFAVVSAWFVSTKIHIKVWSPKQQCGEVGPRGECGVMKLSPHEWVDAFLSGLG
jgi:hypothetical protein